ncbi:class D beta-lactamase [soil metagenome]
MKKPVIIFIFLFLCSSIHAQDLNKIISDAGVKGSITIYDYRNKKWIFSDKKDAKKSTLPASTFKIINSLIGVEERAVKDEYDIIKWDGIRRDREELNSDSDMKNAYKISNVAFYQEIARRVGKNKYKYYLKACSYGNLRIGKKTDEFWLDGSLRITPKQQINFLKDLYEEKLPFSKRTYDIVKSIMINEQNEQYTLYAKTGWGQIEGKDTGWWVGYFVTKDNIYFFATRLIKELKTVNENFGQLRKDVTYSSLKQMGFIY